eukprot:10317379-Prorocentrum_lima.AAC.1
MMHCGLPTKPHPPVLQAPASLPKPPAPRAASAACSVGECGDDMEVLVRLTARPPTLSAVSDP